MIPGRVTAGSALAGTDPRHWDCGSGGPSSLLKDRDPSTQQRRVLALFLRLVELQQNRASVDSAKAAVELGHQSLDAEQKKYQFGTSTNTLVLQFQSQLATAESTLVNAMVAYEKSRVELDRATGQLLDHAGVSIDDAARGQVTRLPNVPYIAPRKDLPSVAQPAPQTSSSQQPQ